MSHYTIRYKDNLLLHRCVLNRPVTRRPPDFQFGGLIPTYRLEGTTKLTLADDYFPHHPRALRFAMPSLTGRTSVIPINIGCRSNAVTAAKSSDSMMANDLWEGWWDHCPSTLTSSLPSSHFCASRTASDPAPPSLPGHVIWSCAAVTWKSMVFSKP